MSALAPTLEAFFSDRLTRQREASPHTVAAYRDTFRLLLAFVHGRTGKSPSALDFDDLDAPLVGAFLAHLEQDRGNGTRTGRWATTMRFFAGPKLLVIDEVGYLPLPAEAAAALFQVVSQRYQKGSIALMTNLGIASWGRIFDDPTVAAAMLDRLLHRSVVFNIDGDSYRMRAHRARAEQVRKGVVVRSGG
jgi:hypothetical protein